MPELSVSQAENIKRLQKLEDQGIINKSRITKLTKVEYTGKVFDIEVSNTNCYQLNGIFSSNSAAGSLVCFLLGIHAIDPLLWELSFDRFMASSRGGYLLKVYM